MAKFPELKTARLLSEEEMLELKGGADNCSQSCKNSCVTCSTSCVTNRTGGTAAKPPTSLLP